MQQNTPWSRTGRCCPPGHADRSDPRPVASHGTKSSESMSNQPESFKSPRIIDTCELAVKSRVSSGAGSAENESDKLPGPLMAYRACL